MKKAKKALALVLATASCVSVLSSCNKPADNSSNSSSAAPVKVVIACIGFNNASSSLPKINDAVNKLLKKDNITIDWQLYGPADYNTKCNLALESGTQLDAFIPLDFTGVLAKKQAYPMETLIDQYAKGSRDILYKDFGTDAFKSVTVNGHIYGMPVNRGEAVNPWFIYDAAMMKETGYSASDIKSLNDLPKIFDAVKAKHPSTICLAPLNVNPSDTMALYTMKLIGKVDNMTDRYGAGVVVGNSGKVVNLFETDIFKNCANMMRSWYLKGYFSKDIATTTTNATDLIRAGRAFSTMGGYNGNEQGVALLHTGLEGKPMGVVKLSNFYFDSQATQMAWVISSTSQHPDAAMKLLNETMTNKDVLNTLLYGIEGEDYVKVDKDHVKYPDGKTAATVPYTAQLCSGVLGSEKLQYLLDGTSTEYRDSKTKDNISTPRSPYFGFTFDQSPVKNEMSAIINVYNQYYSGLVTGSVDPTTAIPKFVKALKDAGIDTVISEKQSQLDKWIAAQKK